MVKNRLDNQEMELRDYSNLKKEFNALALKNKDLIYRGATTNGLLEVSSVPKLSKCLFFVPYVCTCNSSVQGFGVLRECGGGREAYNNIYYA